MNHRADLKPARVFTTFGTVMYFDVVGGALRHGPIDTSPDNVVLTAWGDRQAQLVGRLGGSELMLAGREVISPAEVGQAALTLDRVPLERGLFGLSGEGRFLCAEQDGSVSLSRSACSLWESFLGSEDWCGEAGADASAGAIDWRAIQRFIIDPRVRAKSGVGVSRTKVLIYGYPQWSHGRVYYDLCKQLSARGYVIDIIDWQQNHAEYFGALTTYYDWIMTAPDGVRTLIDSYGMRPERMIVVSHSELDLRILTDQKGSSIFSDFGAFGVVSESVYSASLIQGIPRLPKVTPLGVDYEAFFMPTPARLDVVGYASSMRLEVFGVDVKRGRLAEAAAAAAHLSFRVAGNTADQISFHDMPDFYRSVSAVVTSSISESGPLTVMEAAAAGRLVIGTPVGHFPMKAYQGGGIIAPIEPDKFVAFVTDQLNVYKADPGAFVSKCQDIQEAARQFDWRFAIGDWVALIDATGSGSPT